MKLLCVNILLTILIKANAQDVKYTQVALKIGNVEITTYEFEKNYNQVFASQQLKNGQNNTQKDQKEWIDGFVDYTYFLADAYKKGFVNDPRVNDEVDRMAKYIITQPQGLYEEKILPNDIKITEEEILQAYEKKSKYLVSFFVFKSLDEMNKLLSKKIPKNKEEFYQILAKNQNLKKNNLVEDSLLCPCQFNEKRIGLDSLKENQVSAPLTTVEGVYLFLLKKKGDIPEKYDDAEKKSISDQLAKQKKDLIRKNYREELLKAISLKTDTSLTKEFLKRLQNDPYYQQSNYAINKSIFSDILDRSLFGYIDGDKRKNITINQFADYVNNSIIRAPLTNQITINSYIKEFPIEEIFYKEAIALGIDKDIQFQMDKKNYRNKIVYYYYEKDFFSDSKKVTEQELMDSYNKNINLFIDNSSLHIKPFSEARAEVEEIEFQQRLKELKTKKLAELKQQFDIKNNLTHLENFKQILKY